ncbi:major facilitator superfamily domain-containing protein [Microdochium trichocladiopsis]|uniref:Major facilitator superfamily domain-containing protein n=1 Tax=Microdochium trichocladiopsis TaxID=1682393 RepID=A0A9P8XUJ6_9PEZI|nr:major facilitator superfamily domain-containing protein [Microdochium trichocladiopsis]KAH7018160.1 major facilitator superfamily domain-containing protein [Microdochium trichocladiopsis]
MTADRSEPYEDSADVSASTFTTDRAVVAAPLQRTQQRQDGSLSEERGGVLDAEKATDKNAAQPRDEDKEPYSIYTRRERWCIVLTVAFAGVYSTLPATIYFPAVPLIGVSFGVSQEAINQTVTAYLVMQGISPMLWGPLSDRYGRRPVYLACLTVLLGSCVGLALCPENAFWLLIFLRLFQAGGCASMIALGAGVTGDIATPEERGGYFGFFNLGPMLATCVGPAIGGALADGLGWRAIFWALVIMAAICMVLISLFLPETLRSLVGNGSIRPPNPVLNQPVIKVFGRGVRTHPAPKRDPSAKKPSINPFILFTYPDVALTLSFNAVTYSVYYSIMATTSSALEHAYPWLSTTLLGIGYLPTGLGMILGATLTGKLLDREYARAKSRHAAVVAEAETAAAAVAGGSSAVEVPRFPKEHARLRTMPAHVVLMAAAVVGWGACIGHSVPIAAPLVLQAILGYTGMAVLNSTTTLMIDILQSRSSSATACINCTRCLLGAMMVGVTERMVSSVLGYTWAYLLLAGICLLCIPLMYLEMKIGPRFRIPRDKAAEEDSKKAGTGV